jgi:hypothetical protein
MIWKHWNIADKVPSGWLHESGACCLALRIVLLHYLLLLPNPKLDNGVIATSNIRVVGYL